MSRLYLQKGGIDHFTDLGVQLDNKSYTPMSIDGGVHLLELGGDDPVLHGIG